MSSYFDYIYNNTAFLLSNLSWFDVIDLALVTAAFYFMLMLIQRGPVRYAMREIVLLGLGLFILTVLLPLPIFDWLIRGVLIAVLVATPIIFQAQLRRFFERVGRTIGLTRAVRESTGEQVIPELVRVVTDMTTSKTGGLIVLEGNDSLDEVIKSGIAIEGKVTSELLETIFYVGTPLHDGSVIVRGDQIVAAGCVLPLTQQFLAAEKRLGTRHRAAVGVSESSDALVIVVSEETGYISLAEHGNLDRPITQLELRERLQDFYGSFIGPTKSVPVWHLLNQGLRQVRASVSSATPNTILSNLGLLIVATMMSIVFWSFVVEQTNPFQNRLIEGIRLRIENQPDNAQIIPTPPEFVTARIQTTEDNLSGVNADMFKASLSLEETGAGLYRLPIEVESLSPRVLVLSTDPESVDFEIAPVISRTLSIVVNIANQSQLPTAYELVGLPSTKPREVAISGPAPMVARVRQVETTISLANVTTPIRETHTLQAMDETGQEVTGVEIDPGQVQVTANISPRINAREVSVQAQLDGAPPLGYQMSTLRVTPDSVTLQGSVNELTELENVVNTRALDISQATTDLIVQVPLDLPPNVQALDSSGNSIRTVTVSVGITTRSGNTTLSRMVQVSGTTPNQTVTVEPEVVELLVSGAQPLLNDIDANPSLLQVQLDVSGLRPGQTVNMTPDVVAPDSLETQLVPSFVQVTLEEPAP